MTTEGTSLAGGQSGTTAQRETETRLSDSLSLLEAVTNSTADAVFVKDRAGRYVLANPAVCALFGVPDGGVVGRTDFDFLPEDEARRLRENDGEIMTSGAVQVYEEEVTVVPVLPKASGAVGRGTERRVFQVTKSLWRDPATGDILGIVGIGQDVTERVAAQRELAYREREYAALVDNSPDVLARYDRDKRIVSVNRAGERHSGTKAASLVGKTFREAGFPEGIIPIWDAALDRALQKGEAQIIEFSLPFPGDGTLHHYESVVTPEFAPENAGAFSDDDGRDDDGGESGHIVGVIAVTRDVTERARAERERAESEERLRLALESGGMGGWDADLLTGNLSFSPEIGPLYGRPREAVTIPFSQWAEEWLHPEDRQRVPLAFELALRGEAPYDVRFRTLWPDGETSRWVATRALITRDAGGTPVRAVGYTRDVTEEQEREAEREAMLAEQARLLADLERANARQRERLTESEERFRLFVEQVEDYAIFMLDAEGRVVTWNAGAQRFMGYGSQEIIGRHFSRFYTSEDVSRRHPWNELEIAARAGRYEEEGWRVRKDGYRFWAHVVIVALRDEGGELRGFGKVTRDVTERRQRERERAAAEALKQQRRFLKDVLVSVTQGKLILCDSPRELPTPLSPAPVGEPIRLSARALKAVRVRVADTARACALPRDREQDLLTASSECAMNAVQHAGGGVARVYGDADAGQMQVWVEDTGTGIDLKNLPRATLESGFSTGGVGIGHGFSLILSCCQHVYLLTGPRGTTVVLEMDRETPEPAWLRSAG